jgi:L-histidine N-alpha-methyltransferase
MSRVPESTVGARHGVPLPANVQDFADDVAHDLALMPKRLQPKYLYDDLGSSLFGAICHLPWYRITRAEKALLGEHRAAIAAAAGQHVRVIELGCGTGEKLQVLAEGFVRCGNEAEIHLVDVSQLALDQTVNALAGTHLPVVCHQTTYEEGVARAALCRGAGEAMLVLFLGSNIGNFDPPAALHLLRRIRAPLLPGDRLLLGVDLVKPARDLQLAYDDPLGVTAAFNKNVLVRMNRELDADFDVSSFAHLARWNAAESRVEMHLASAHRQVVRIPGAGVTASFFTGETIWTESSYKYETVQIGEMAGLAAFDVSELWIDADARFALALLRAV